MSLALKLAPDIAALVKQVIIMGGTVDEPGNVSPVAEANIWNDPHAADIVFRSGVECSGCCLHNIFLFFDERKPYYAQQKRHFNL